LIDTTFQETRQCVGVIVVVTLGMAVVNEEVNILFNVTSVVSDVVDSWVLASVTFRGVEEEIFNGEFIVNASRIPCIIAGKENVR
jgi:hypothetical protein